MYNANHEDFLVEQVGDHFELWYLNCLTREKSERFGLYSHWWKAEREARRLQKWADTEKWQ